MDFHRCSSYSVITSWTTPTTLLIYLVVGRIDYVKIAKYRFSICWPKNILDASLWLQFSAIFHQLHTFKWIYIHEDRERNTLFPLWPNSLVKCATTSIKIMRPLAIIWMLLRSAAPTNQPTNCWPHSFNYSQLLRGHKFNYWLPAGISPARKMGHFRECCVKQRHSSHTIYSVSVVLHIMYYNYIYPVE